ncbi:MAG TPA: UpxY family transcription antiterminator [Chitinophagaceae bacterium]|jgi:transcription antitermination factor NusG|nr:UpxY family transcription antiterminator [Chitinophagaceae bacterium]
MQDQKQWFVLYTKPRCEKKVAELLRKRNIEHYFPLNQVGRSLYDRVKTNEVPLFPNYVFVYTDASRHQYIRDISGVLNFVYWLGKPAVVKQEEIDAIQQFLEEYRDVRLERVDVNPKDHVRVLNGPSLHQQAEVIDIYQRKIKVLLPSLGYCMVAELTRSNIQVLRTYHESAV